jgi:DNA-binding CsgD family transcriptional regulator
MPDTKTTASPAALSLTRDDTLALARLLRTIGTVRFPVALSQLLRRVCDFESIVATSYPPNGPPVSLHHDLDDVQAAISVQFYATGPYLLDPLYLACRADARPGVYRTLDLAPEAFFRSEYYRTFYRNIRISDEIGLLIKDSDTNWIILSLARQARQPRFTALDLERLDLLFPVLEAAVLKNWGAMTTPEPDNSAVMEDRLREFGKHLLSPREAEIVQLILQGHSTPSLAAFLGISEGTVKVHRHNAYSKLGISSQAELFSLATRHFMTPET